MTARPGTRQWVWATLRRNWAADWRELVALGAGQEPLSHTAGLWLASTVDERWVFKVQIVTEAIRPSGFYPLKDRVLAGCAAAGVPVRTALPACDGAVVAWADGHVCEMVPYVPGEVVRDMTEAHARTATAAGLDLVRVLRAADADLVTAMAGIHLPPLVEEPRWRVALADAEHRLLAMARRRDDAWGSAVTAALRGLVAARPLLSGAADEIVDGARTRRALVHGDLHRHHFLFAGQASTTVLAVLDFDNLHVGDRLLDIAWLAEIAGAGPAAAAEFLASAFHSGLLRPGEERLLMPVLIAHTLPVIVDIAKDVLERDILLPAWFSYLELLDPRRRLDVHRLLIRTSARPNGVAPHDH